ncbi:hypothetical protein OSB04_002650 [Centaurea solstitialis]|uniref:Integrase catalytic domain-containing protein n=1 Tax=Centaurea solstitialis TaxID=347529 RepID=A0AA38TTR9_9ASTR|nr:hypothetical protein OSB04_002650 [Centaurea solstitialis]
MEPEPEPEPAVPRMKEPEPVAPVLHIWEPVPEPPVPVPKPGTRLTGSGGYPAVSGSTKMRTGTGTGPDRFHILGTGTGTTHTGSGSGTGGSIAVPVPKAGTRFRCSPLVRDQVWTKARPRFEASCGIGSDEDWTFFCSDSILDRILRHPEDLEGIGCVVWVHYRFDLAYRVVVELDCALGWRDTLAVAVRIVSLVRERDVSRQIDPKGEPALAARNVEVKVYDKGGEQGFVCVDVKQVLMLYLRERKAVGFRSNLIPTSMKEVMWRLAYGSYPRPKWWRDVRIRREGDIHKAAIRVGFGLGESLARLPASLLSSCIGGLMNRVYRQMLDGSMINEERTLAHAKPVLLDACVSYTGGYTRRLQGQVGTVGIRYLGCSSSERHSRIAAKLCEEWILTHHFSDGVEVRDQVWTKATPCFEASYGIGSDEDWTFLLIFSKYRCYTSVKNEEAWVWLTRLKLVKGLPDIRFQKDHLCSAYEMGKLKRSSHKTKSDPSYDKPLQMLYVDLCGPIAVQSLGGKKYVLVLVDEFSRYTWVEFVKNKSQVPLLLIILLKRLQVLHSLQVRVLRSDNGIEFTIEDYLTSVGITHNFSAPRTPQQNEVVERKIRTIVKAARTMLNASGLALTFWAERFEKTPYQLLYNKRPNIKLFHVFGCKCFVINDREPIGKFDPKGDDAIFIGYAWDSIAYRVYIPKTQTAVVSTNVTQDKFTKELKIQAEASRNATITQDLEKLFSEWSEEFGDPDIASADTDRASASAG